VAETTVFSPQRADLIKAPLRFQVRVSDTWASGWERADYIEPLTAEDVAGGAAHSKAELLFRYGRAIKREDASSFDQAEPEDLRGKFVAIDMLPSQGPAIGQVGPSSGGKPVNLWVGILTEETFDIHGSEGEPQGNQRFTAYGLEYLLDRVTIAGAFVAGDDGAIEIDWSPVFNERFRHGVQEIGNRSSAPVEGDDDQSAYVFSHDEEPWSNLDVAEYLIEWFMPRNGPVFKISGQTDTIEKAVERHDFEGWSIKQALDVLIDRRLGVGWEVRANDEDETVEIHVFSVLDESVGFADVQIPANAEQVEFDFGDAQDIEAAVVTEEEHQRYDEILVQGARITSCFTVGVGQFKPGWGEAQEAAYKAAAGEEDAALNDSQRLTDTFWRVYRVLALTDDWDWKSIDGHRVDVEVDEEGRIVEDSDVSAEPRIYKHGRALLRALPFEKPGGDERSEPEYRPPFVLGLLPESPSDKDWWFYLDAPPADGQVAPHSLRMLDREFAFELHSHTNHTLALDAWKSGDNPASTLVEPQVAWEDLIATLNVELDARLQVKVELSEDDESGQGRRLVVRVPDAQLWYVVPKTVSEVSKGALLKHAGGAVRDDSERLRRIAALAKAWFSRDRAAVTLVLKSRIHLGLKVGQLVTDASSGTQRRRIGTVITRRHFDFRERKTTIQTSWTQLDFGSLVR